MIVTGPSGGGQDDAADAGRRAPRARRTAAFKVLGQELRGARERTLEAVRQQIGFIFQAHNLIEALSALQNVEMALRMSDARPARGRATSRARDARVGRPRRIACH